MGIITYSAPYQYLVSLNLELPLCLCGHSFNVFEHRRKRNDKLLGVTAKCTNSDCPRNLAPYIGHNAIDLIKVVYRKIKEAQPNDQKCTDGEPIINASK